MPVMFLNGSIRMQEAGIREKYLDRLRISMKKQYLIVHERREA